VPDDDVRTVTGDVVDGPRGPMRTTGPGARADGDDPLDGVVRVRTFRLSDPPGGIGVWLGGGLVALGVYLVLAAWFPAVAAVGSGAVAIVGAVLLGAGLTRRLGSWAVYLGALVLAVGIVRLAGALGLLPGGGWTTLAIGIAFLGLAGYRATQGRGWRPLAVFGGMLGVIGGIQALGGVIPGFPTLGELVLPALLVGAGAIVLARATHRG
jgi:hypothetical protein